MFTVINFDSHKRHSQKMIFKRFFSYYNYKKNLQQDFIIIFISQCTLKRQ